MEEIKARNIKLTRMQRDALMAGLDLLIHQLKDELRIQYESNLKHPVYQYSSAVDEDIADSNQTESELLSAFHLSSALENMKF